MNKTKNRSLEALREFIARYMGYKYCVLFPRARDAIRAFEALAGVLLPLPTNICPAARAAISGGILVPVDLTTGLAPVPVQLYGYRVRHSGVPLDLDPLMTGWYGKPFAPSSIISFGRHKIVNVGGGAFLTQESSLAEEMSEHEYFPPGFIGPLSRALQYLPETIEKRFERIAIWDRHLGDCCTRIPCEQVMPWRVMRRITGNCLDNSLIILSKRDAVVMALRGVGVAVGTNYQRLPGVTDQRAIRWGAEVINFLLEGPDYEEAGPDYADYVLLATETIKRVIG